MVESNIQHGVISIVDKSSSLFDFHEYLQILYGFITFDKRKFRTPYVWMEWMNVAQMCIFGKKANVPTDIEFRWKKSQMFQK